MKMKMKMEHLKEKKNTKFKNDDKVRDKLIFNIIFFTNNFYLSY